MTHRDIRRLVIAVIQLQHAASQRGFTRVGVRLNAAGDELISDPKGVAISMSENPRNAVMRLLNAPVKEGEE